VRLRTLTPSVWALILTLIVIPVCIGSGQAQGQDDHELYIEFDVMERCDFPIERICDAFRSVGCVGLVDIRRDERGLKCVKYLGYYPGGPRKYMSDHRDSVTRITRDWQLYVLAADRYTREKEDAWRGAILGNYWPSYTGRNRCMCAIYIGAIKNFCEDPELRCWNLYWESACIPVTLHEIGNCLGLEDIYPEVKNPCMKPEPWGVMVRHPHSLTLDGYCPREIRQINESDGP
jgi:hypothetical protein